MKFHGAKSSDFFVILSILDTKTRRGEYLHNHTTYI